jgi:hypothetical protein
MTHTQYSGLTNKELVSLGDSIATTELERELLERLANPPRLTQFGGVQEREAQFDIAAQLKKLNWIIDSEPA